MTAPDLPEAKWRKTRRSGGEGGNCIELAYVGMARDSKNPTGPILRVELARLLTVVKSGRLDR